MGLIRPLNTGLTKTAAGLLPLPPATASWSRSILQEAYRQIPMLQDLSATLDIQKVDEARGYGTGRLILKTASQATRPGEDQPPVVLPITIRDRKMDPLDVLMVGDDIFPFSETKLASVFENLSMGALDQAKPRNSRVNPNLNAYLRPPSGTGRGNTSMKTASETLLKLAASTADEEARTKFAAAVRSPEVLRSVKSAETQSALDLALSAPVMGLDQLRDTVDALVQPDIFDITSRKNGTYQVKSASRHFFSLEAQTLSRFEAEQLVGTEKLAAVDSKGRVLAFTPVPGCEEVCLAEEYPISGTGLYKTSGAKGDGPAFVIQEPLDVSSGKKLAGYIVSDGDSYNYQASLGGEFISLPKGAGTLPNVHDHGSFIWGTGTEHFGTTPVKIAAEVSAVDGGWSYQVVLPTGQMASVHLGNVQDAAIVEDGLVLPKEAGFVSFANARTTYKTAEEYHFHKEASLKKSGSVELLPYGDSRYILRGSQLADVHNKPLDRQDTEFVLAALGVADPEDSLNKLAVSRKMVISTPVELQFESILRKEAFDKAVEQHHAFPEELGYQDEIVKLATALPPDRETLDTILALNFLNPDNLRVIQEYVPEIEKTASRLAEVLVATRMGLRGDPEPIRLAMQYVRRVSEQLKAAIPEGA